MHNGALLLHLDFSRYFNNVHSIGTDYAYYNSSSFHKRGPVWGLCEAEGKNQSQKLKSKSEP